MHHLTLALLLALTAPLLSQNKSMRLNQIQVIGSHNSYHLEPTSPIVRLFTMGRIEWKYSHRPLEEQFQELGVRQIELDIWPDPDGGRYASPYGAGRGVVIEELTKPGFKVLHVPDIDYRTTVPTLRVALEQLREWSRANPRHLPILVLFEVKSDVIPDPLKLGFVRPPAITAEDLDELDEEIRAALPAEMLITPDDIRKNSKTLKQALARRGWPKLDDARGKILCALDNPGREKRLYLDGHPSLRGRVMFVDSRPGDDYAAFAKINGPVGNVERIQKLVKAGLLVRTRADAHTREAHANDTSRRDAALQSGAHFISTDFPEAKPEVVDSDYVVRMPDGSHARCNPVNGPRKHDAEALLDEGLTPTPDKATDDSTGKPKKPRQRAKR